MEIKKIHDYGKKKKEKKDKPSAGERNRKHSPVTFQHRSAAGTQSAPSYAPHFFAQFSPGGIHPSHSNTVLHAGTQSAPRYTSFTSALEEVELAFGKTSQVYRN
ncbi:unnamed protein product [Trifolium pratense]|uniref:Uncharacterized protein n=1 Tax=Trifolium pratense TaxID=57577 RepID=A0ACB0LE88_TRIPR|nr:unnamed protein product [Trifolium pratense]